MLVSTSRGLIQAADLQIEDAVTLEDNARVTATEYRFKGELVRRDVWVSMLRGVSTAVQSGTL